MASYEIEKKFLLQSLPDNLDHYPCQILEQGYLSTEPVVRVRKENDSYYLTYKGGGKMIREEYNLSLTEAAYYHLLEKSDGNIICKHRYLIPLEGSNLTIELDIFDPPFAPLIMAEVEFTSEEEANNFIPPKWFGEEVTMDPAYHNSNMSRLLL